jgi:hypothetical protein
MRCGTRCGGTGGGAGVDQEVVPRSCGGCVGIKRIGVDVPGQDTEIFAGGTNQGVDVVTLMSRVVMLTKPIDITVETTNHDFVPEPQQSMCC